MKKQLKNIGERRTEMPSIVFKICNSYESGYGHGLQEDGLDLNKTPHDNPDCGEAYQIGYEAGLVCAKNTQHDTLKGEQK